MKNLLIVCGFLFLVSCGQAQEEATPMEVAPVEDTSTLAVDSAQVESDTTVVAE
jgi:PBP1b-binding outer membrane lipoprotein LpoB